MKQHLIVCDLDGSLLNKKGHVSSRSKKVLNHLRSQGHIVVLATGRPYSGAISKYEDIGLDTPLITDNGGSIENPRDHNFPRQKTYIPLHMMHDLFRFSKSFIISAFYSEEQVVYAYQYDERLEEFFSGINSGMVIDKEMTEFNVAPTGLIYLIKKEHQKELETYIDQTFGQTLSYRLWGVYDQEAVYEIYLKHISKASAIKYLLEIYGIAQSEWISFGDGVNDLEMIREAGLGVAMKNALPELKAVSKDITKYTHDEDGIAKYLIKMFNLKNL
jgi:5-amino-6-(5-phospho-D-ribitylamino)uracil phosphatase